MNIEMNKPTHMLATQLNRFPAVVVVSFIICTPLPVVEL